MKYLKDRRLCWGQCIWMWFWKHFKVTMFWGLTWLGTTFGYAWIVKCLCFSKYGVRHVAAVCCTLVLQFSITCWNLLFKETFFALEPLPFILLLFKYLMIDSFLPVTEDFTCPFCLMKCGNFKVMFFGATFFLCVVFIFHPFLQTVDPKDYVSYFTLKVDNISQR